MKYTTLSFANLMP